MITLLRRIRRRLVAGGETKKYLKYAIGEIILVVVGILIALSINNWNTNRLKRHSEIKFYQTLKEQITQDSINIAGQIRYNNYYREQYTYGIELIEKNDREKIDTLVRIATNTTQYSDFDRRDNIYENTVNSGDIQLIQNDSIILSLIALEENLMYLNRIESIHYEAMMSHAIPAIKSLIKFNTAEPMDVDKLYGFEFQNALFLFTFVSEEKDMVYRNAQVTISRLKRLLENEIKNR